MHVDVRHMANGVEMQLFEDRQEFKDGRVRRRGLVGLSEKMKPDENPLLSAKRALAEELSFNSAGDIDDLGIERVDQQSPSYPGLPTEYLIHNMKTELPANAYNPEGYVEKQSDKSTFFIWKEILRKR